MEVLGFREEILLNMHRGELLDKGDRHLVEGQAVAGRGQTAGG